MASADIRRFWPLEAPQERVRCFRSRTERKRVAFAANPPGLSALRRSKISSGVNKPATARALSRTLEGEDVMTCCAAAICAVVRHSVSSPLPVLAVLLCLGIVMHAWALRAVTVHVLPPHAQATIHRAAHRHDHCVAV